MLENHTSLNLTL